MWPGACVLAVLDLVIARTFSGAFPWFATRAAQQRAHLKQVRARIVQVLREKNALGPTQARQLNLVFLRRAAKRGTRSLAMHHKSLHANRATSLSRVRPEEECALHGRLQLASFGHHGDVIDASVHQTARAIRERCRANEQLAAGVEVDEEIEEDLDAALGVAVGLADATTRDAEVTATAPDVDVTPDGETSAAPVSPGEAPRVDTAPSLALEDDVVRARRTGLGDTSEHSHAEEDDGDATLAKYRRAPVEMATAGADATRIKMGEKTDPELDEESRDKVFDLPANVMAIVVEADGCYDATGTTHHSDDDDASGSDSEHSHSGCDANAPSSRIVSIADVLAAYEASEAGSTHA